MIGAICILGVLLLIGVIYAIYKYVDNKHAEVVKKSSKLYSNVLKLNKKYKFNDLDHSTIYFNPELRSKRSLDNLDLYQYTLNEIEQNLSYYMHSFEKADENKEIYNKYLKEYNALEKYITQEEYASLENMKIKYDSYVKHEKKLFANSRLEKPITSISVRCKAEYTSPSGRNYYEKTSSYDFGQLKEMVQQIHKNQEMKLAEQQKKEALAQKRREKEKRLRELDKLEVKLNQKEKEINRKEQEFIKATKGHIYSSDKIVEDKQNDITENLTISQKIEVFKSKFDNGEITYEEYQTQRKNLL